MPFFILCLAVTGHPDHDKFEQDLILVTWISNYVEEASNERVDLKPVSFVMKIMAVACQQESARRLLVSEIKVWKTNSSL